MATVTFITIFLYNWIRSHAIRKRFWDLAPYMNVGVATSGTGGYGTGKGSGEKMLGKYSWGWGPLFLDDEYFKRSAREYPCQN